MDIVIGAALTAASYGWITLVDTDAEGIGRAFRAIIIAALVWGIVRLIRREPLSASLWLCIFWLLTALFTVASLMVLNQAP